MTVREVCQSLNRLDPEQLQAVDEFVALLLATDDDQGQDDQDQDDQDQEERAGGWVEWKYIRGYGPYAYWRYRSGGRLKSKYLGKDVSKAPSV